MTSHSERSTWQTDQSRLMETDERCPSDPQSRNIFRGFPVESGSYISCFVFTDNVRTAVPVRGQRSDIYVFDAEFTRIR